MAPFNMKPAVIVLLLVSRGDMQQPAMVALTRAAERALGPESRIVLHEQTAPLLDEEAMALAEQMRASVVVEVSWSDDRGRAHLHVHFAERAGWLERDLAFSPGEPLVERGRTLGFEIASMVPDLAPETRPPPSEPERRAPPPDSPERLKWAVDVAAIGSLAGDASGVGGAIGGRWLSANGGFVRLGMAARFGQVATANASSMTLGPGAGLGWMWGGSSRWRAGIRADGFALFTRLSRSMPDESRARWVPGLDLLAEVELDASPVLLAFAAGPEYAFGKTEIRVGDTQTATLPRLRLTGELGLRLRF